MTPVYNLLLQPKLIYSPLRFTSCFANVEVVLGVCDKGQVKILVVKRDQHRAVYDLLTNHLWPISTTIIMPLSKRGQQLIILSNFGHFLKPLSPLLCFYPKPFTPL